MSGFVVVLARRGGAVDEALLARLAAPLAAHGPHGRGARRDGPVAMASSLLAVREHATAGPHGSPRGAWLAGDVRLDAQGELRRRLAASGDGAPPDSSESALLLAAWHAWGEDCVAHLRGDFSFALWDPARHALFCARDPWGVRPLYYADLGDAFVCSNVLAAVRAHPAVSSRLHEPAIVSFLHHGFNVDLTTTTFADVRRLPPAHQMLVPAEAPARAPRRHWSFPVPPPLTYRRDEQYVEHYRAVLGEAVRDRLRAPRTAILMSGGLDSPSLAATARRAAPEVRLAAFTTVVSAVQHDDEGRLASAVARRLGLEHEVIGDVPMPLEHLADSSWTPPEPYDESDHATWRRVLQRVATASPVVLIGEDGDALFRPPSLASMLRAWPALDVAARVARFTLSHRRLPHLGTGLRRRWRGDRIVREVPLPDWVRREVVARTGVPRPPAMPPHPTRPLAQTFLLGAVWQSFLESCDPAYTGAAVEVRWPLLDLRVVEFALAIPPVPWCQQKELVRVAFRDELPQEVLARDKTTQRGYSEVQVARWRAHQGGAAIALHPLTEAFVDAARVADNLRGGSVEQVLAAWRVLSLDAWLRRR